jgi:hypothetical protein
MKTVAALIVLVVVAAGCAGPVRGMRELPPGTEVTTKPPAGKAAIVFMRPSGLGFAVSSSVFEVKKDGDVFVAIVPAKKKVVYFTDPGATRFMVIGESADFMGADLEAGKTYYALVSPRMGWWKARFSLRPVAGSALDGKEFAEWLEDCAWIENTPAAQEWARQNAGSVREKKVEYMPKWDTKIDKPMLRAPDGR